MEDDNVEIFLEEKSGLLTVSISLLEIIYIASNVIF